MSEEFGELKKELKGKIMIMVGPPLSGKGTQAKNLSKELELPTVSTGELFRAEAKAKSEYGINFEKYMSQGQLIPNELMEKFLVEKLGADELKDGFLLDGFPREESHVALLDTMMEKLNLKLFAVLYFDYSTDILIKRLKKRSEENSGSKRSDDTEEVVQKRMKIYNANTPPMIQLLPSDKIVVHKSASDSPEDITKHLLQALTKLASKTNSNDCPTKIEDANSAPSISS
eukprot:TRINITY_DN1796_c0_g1_i1.p1 TRINITY_DN1796_c0_g1~~TRINITY_DN1796_c0_g1_i1.p1  ORF type:complete len:230 (-),score=64.52 TRINITY_DN1796_c0_g1_i1:62-751(-)